MGEEVGTVRPGGEYTSGAPAGSALRRGSDAKRGKKRRRPKVATRICRNRPCVYWLAIPFLGS
jgi:hypothetical protein